MEQNIFMCIDLKSFFASVECADRGLDPFTANLVVSDPSRGRDMSSDNPRDEGSGDT